jgi:hypothetical protein
MELFLNLLWLAIAVGLTGFLLCQQRSRAFHPSWGLVLVATMFIAVLLFPTISASDDLYNDAFLSEDVSRRASSVISMHLDVAPAVALVLAVPLNPVLSGLRFSERVAEAGSLVALPSSYCPATGLRAPPVSQFS